MITNYFSMPIAHPEIKNAYYGTFGVPRSSRQFVMKNGTKQIFLTKDAAELAGYRSMIELMNNPINKIKERPSRENQKTTTDKNSADHVFSNFRKKDK